MKLDSYFFTNQQVKANPAHNPAASIAVHTKTDIQANRIDGSRDAVGIEVTIVSDEAKCENPPYTFELTAFGVFVFNEETPGEIAPVNASGGASVLLGALRERLADLTARGPWKPVLLEPIFLRPMVLAENSAAETSKADDA